MTRGLRIGGDGFGLPLDVLSDVTAIVGRRGRGKTTTAVVMVEEAHAAGRRFCVIDPTGVWHGLRSSRDGKAPGIPCVIFGGKHAMAPLEPTAGKLLAEFVGDPSQPSAVLDVKPWSRGEQVRFLGDFLAALYQKNDAPLLLVLDEADQVAPQRPEKNETVMLGAAQRLVKLGRVSGFGVVLITQRPATLSKTVLNMAGVLVSMGITGPQDQEAVLDWMRYRADAAKAREILGSLPGLPQGRAWIWAPELDILRCVDIRDRRTFDSSATPKPGTRIVPPKAVAEVDLARLSAEIQATIERAKANDPAALRAEVARLTRALAAAKQATPEPERVEVPVFSAEEKARLDGIHGSLDATRSLLGGVRSAVESLVGDVATLIGIARQRMPSAAPRPPRPVSPAPAAAKTTATAAPRAAQNHQSSPHQAPRGVEQRVLNVLAELERVRVPRPQRIQVAFLAGYGNLTSKGFANALGALRSGGLIDYPETGRLALTAAGRARADASDAPRTAAELQARVLSILGGAHERLLRPLLTAYPEAISRADLAAAAGYGNLTSKGFANAIGRLRSLGFIEYPSTGTVRARGILFLEEA